MRVLKLLAFCGIAFACVAESPKLSVLGKLIQNQARPPALETSDHKLVVLDGDESTKAVLNDRRLAGANLEATGRFSAAGVFLVDPIHSKALFVHKNGKKLLITYWCDVCSIRTYAPGRCWCCQQETALDLREPQEE